MFGKHVTRYSHFNHLDLTLILQAFLTCGLGFYLRSPMSFKSALTGSICTAISETVQNLYRGLHPSVTLRCVREIQGLTE
jgi:hypothetical protein